TYALNLSHLVKEGADEVYTTLAGLQSPISTYFEATMVNTENTAVKNNRYAQLNVIHRLISELGDLEQIVIK
ncbi:MAG: glycine--tRNA ligase subunit beta, partial [Leuconostoc mesenteroides]